MYRHSQKGSALLIVLGFLSFMVVSAVAFSVWMRTERVPSSALRRSVANRYLVKAAIAQAMSQVDNAVRSHVFPGAWNTNSQNTAFRDANGCAFDWWEGRVFMPPDPEGTSSPGDLNSRYAPVSKTVPVLSLEAMGYLPPAIANDVRLLSRSSWAAKWDYFNFDAGRYAFCAVNVSDMLDATKIAANSPRTSAAAVRPQESGKNPPPSRFSAAYLFRNGNENFSNLHGEADTFDKFVHTSREEWSTAPLVSLMDYNLSIGRNMTTYRSPFYFLASGLNTKPFFYGANVGENVLVKAAERQPFVTDSWFPKGDAEQKATLLDISKLQPFKNNTLEKDDSSIMDILAAENNEFWNPLVNEGFCFWDMITLFDYLDFDSTPASLAMPCVEQVPMLAGLEAQVNVKVEFVKNNGQSDGEELKGDVKRKFYDTKIKITTTGGIGSKLLYPFKGGQPPKNCQAEAFARLVFVAEDAAGGGNAAPLLPLRNNRFATNFKPLKESEWTDQVAAEDQFKIKSSSEGNLSREELENCMVVTLPSRNGASWTPNANITSVEDAWKDQLLQLQDGNVERAIVRRVEEYKVTKNETTGAETETLLKDRTRYQILLDPFDVNGNVIKMDTSDGGAGMIESEFNERCDKYILRPYLVVWSRVKQDGVTVDMAPATFHDDLALNKVDNMALPDLYSDHIGAFDLGNKDPKTKTGIDALPIMRFPGEMTFTYRQASNGDTLPNNTWSRKSFFSVDPRFNWAPEDWFASSETVMGVAWYQHVFGTSIDDDTCAINKMVRYDFGGNYGRGDRAGDPFLFASNQGYLQSVGEFAFLPHLSVMKENGLSISVLGDTRDKIYSDSHEGALYDGRERTLDNLDTDPMPSSLAAWKQYQNFRTNPNGFEFGANMYRRGMTNGSKGIYVNPFTQNQEVMLAALANTPLNYWVASTNYTAEGKTEFKTFNDAKDFTFNENGKVIRMTGRDVNKIATFLRHRFEDLASMVEFPTASNVNDVYAFQRLWEDMFDALDWGGKMGLTVRDVYDDLENKYYSGQLDFHNYREAYTHGNNKYSALNRYALGSNRGSFQVRVNFSRSKAIHSEEFDFSADPLRGQVDNDRNDTTCANSFQDVDRTFLHSYWRDCFLNRQQLFLIFVRAEATALGGSGEGTPAQQGGRGVALVWRDPSAPDGTYVEEGNSVDAMDSGASSDSGHKRHPHKMRILFYRQLD